MKSTFGHYIYSICFCVMALGKYHNDFPQLVIVSYGATHVLISVIILSIGFLVKRTDYLQFLSIPTIFHRSCKFIVLKTDCQTVKSHVPNAIEAIQNGYVISLCEVFSIQNTVSWHVDLTSNMKPDSKRCGNFDEENLIVIILDAFYSHVVRNLSDKVCKIRGGVLLFG